MGDLFGCWVKKALMNKVLKKDERIWELTFDCSKLWGREMEEGQGRRAKV